MRPIPAARAHPNFMRVSRILRALREHGPPGPSVPLVHAADIIAAAKRALDGKTASRSASQEWDGHAEERIAGIPMGRERGA